MFWGVYVFAQSFDVYNVAADFENANPVPLVTFGLGLALAGLSLGCHFFVEPPAEYDGPGKDPDACPEQSASFPSHMTLGWFSG